MEHRDIDVSIRELRQTLPDKLRPFVEESCRENLRRYPHPERSTFKENATRHAYDADETVICNGRFGRLVLAEMLNRPPRRPGFRSACRPHASHHPNNQIPMTFQKTESSLYHEYVHQTTLCKAADYDIARVFEVMLSSTKFIAPTDEDRTVTNGMIVNVNVLMTKHNPITVAITPAVYSVTNTTLPGHVLHPGSVTRKLVNVAGVIIVDTKGVGTGKLQGATNFLPFNHIMGQHLPRRYTPSGAINDTAAAIVWGGVDDLLKKRIQCLGR